MTGAQAGWRFANELLDRPLFESIDDKFTIQDSAIPATTTEADFHKYLVTFSPQLARVSGAVVLRSKFYEQLKTHFPVAARLLKPIIERSHNHIVPLFEVTKDLKLGQFSNRPALRIVFASRQR